MVTLRPHSGQATRYWSVVKANIPPEGEAYEDEFSGWWSDEHVPEYVRRPSFEAGRRLRRVEGPDQEGRAEHKYLAVYWIDSVSTFNEALAAGPPWGPWDGELHRYVCDWERTYYRQILEVEQQGGAGRFWAVVKADLSADADGDAFDRWYATHAAEIAANPGFHRAWRLHVEPDGNDLGPRRQRYWAVYEVDDPQSFADARRRRWADGIEPWDGVWGPRLRDVQIVYYELISTIDHATAVERARVAG